MKLFKSLLLTVTLAFSATTMAAGQPYNINTTEGSSYAYASSVKLKHHAFNYGGSLKALIPVTLGSTDNSSGKISFSFSVSEPIQAVEFVTVFFDPFGRKIGAFSRTDVKDLDPDKQHKSSIKYALSYDDSGNRLASSFTYVSNVRVNDNKLITVDPLYIQKALESINLNR